MKANPRCGLSCGGDFVYLKIEVTFSPKLIAVCERNRKFAS